MALDPSNQLLFQLFFGFNSESRVRICNVTHAVEDYNLVVFLALLIIKWSAIFNLE